MAKETSEVSYESGFVGRVSIALLVLMAALFVPSTDLFSQESSPILRGAIAAGQTARPFLRSFRPSRERMIWSVRRSAARRTLRPVILGTVLGAGLGAFVGHQVAGGQTTCPLSPDYPCTARGPGDISGAVSGALIGGLAGALTGAFVNSRR